MQHHEGGRESNCSVGNTLPTITLSPLVKTIPRQCIMQYGNSVPPQKSITQIAIVHLGEVARLRVRKHLLMDKILSAILGTPMPAICAREHTTLTLVFCSFLSIMGIRNHQQLHSKSLATYVQRKSLINLSTFPLISSLDIFRCTRGLYDLVTLSKVIRGLRLI